MIVESFEEAELEDAWVEGDSLLHWRSAAGHSADGSASSLLEIPAGCRLARHTDSAEEVIVVLAGCARVPHDVENFGEDTLRFAAVYAEADVVTTYETEIQPDGSRERRPAG